LHLQNLIFLPLPHGQKLYWSRLISKPIQIVRKVQKTRVGSFGQRALRLGILLSRCGDNPCADLVSLAMFSKTAHRFDSGGAKSVQFVTDDGQPSRGRAIAEITCIFE
jgi:hypothetical protein